MEERRLDEAIKEWMAVYKKTSVKALTYDRLKISYTLMRNYPIASYRVCDIECKTIQRYLNMLVDDGYSMSTIKKQFNLITAYWKHSMARGVVSNPVYLAVSLPNQDSLAKPKKEIEIYSKIEQMRLISELSTLHKSQYAAAILMLEAGLRVGEVLALRWDDILWNRRALKVRRTLIRESSEAVTYVQNSPKSKASCRTVVLSSLAYKVLERMATRLRNPEGYIFVKPDDPTMPVSYSSLEFHVKSACSKTGVSYKGMHAFRHTFATNCYEKGADVKVLSKALGHSDVSVTYNTYIHLYGDGLEEMRKLVD